MAGQSGREGGMQDELGRYTNSILYYRRLDSGRVSKREG